MSSKAAAQKLDGAGRSWPGGPALALAVAVVFGLALDAWLRLQRGPFSIDDVTYHLMAKNAAEGRLFIANGWEELPSAELETLQIRGTPGGLSAQYPQGYALLAAPFFALFGYSGLYVLNALAFLVATLACHRLALRFFDDSRWAAFAAALWAFATYSWEYALAVWPHSVATAAILLTVVLTSEGLEQEARGSARARLFFGGLLCGLGASVRLDVMLCALPLLAPLLARRRPRELVPGLVFGLGMLPGMALLSFVNLAKWGTLFPLSYGSAAHDEVVPWTLGLLLFLALVLVQQRERIAAALGRRALVAAGVLGAIALAAVPVTRELGSKLAAGLFALLADAGALPVDPTELAIQRTESGAVVYAGGLKKAVLQSCPYFSAGIAGLVAVFRGRNRVRQSILLAGVPLTYAAFYGASAWHGGMCFNMRYLLPLLPFASIAAALGLREVVLGRRALALAFGAGAVVALVLAVFVFPLDASVEQLEGPLLAFPLLLAAVLGLVALLSLLNRSKLLGGTFALLVGLGAGWACLVGFLYDAPHSRALRAHNTELAAAFARHVTDDSLLFALSPDSAYPLVELRRDVRIALPGRDGFRDFQRLASFHARAGRAVFAAFTPPLWGALARGGKLDGFETRALARVGSFELRELRETERMASHSPSLSR